MKLTYTANLYSDITVETGHIIKSDGEGTVKKNQLYIYSTVLGAGIKCKQYSEITVESGTHVKSVKITLNIFAVYWGHLLLILENSYELNLSK